MAVTHRINNEERQHYLLEKHYSLKLKPNLMYVGSLEKNFGWREEPHSHDYLEMIFIVDGKGTITFGEAEEHDVSRGDIVIYNAGVKHHEKSCEDDPMEAKFIAFDHLKITDLPQNWLLPPSYSQIYHTGEMYDIFDRYLNSILQELNNKERLYVEICQNMARTLIMYLFRLINKTEKSACLFENGKMLESVSVYISEHYSENLTLDEISKNCRISKYYLSHIFSKSYGKSLGKYILEYRLDKARDLLSATKLSVSEIAKNVGYSDGSYFCRLFKKEIGLTPLAYRSKNS
ncbi:MAG: AraC family transcriptional regulator [Clostridia bacterium]|nr:AraC family transcriptional regulator [Clostridia bacterium]